MKKFLLIFTLIFTFLFPSKVFAFTDTGKSTVVMDIDSGRVLYQKNKDERRLIASITKIMTFLIAIENGKLDDVYKVGDEVLSMYGTNIYLEVGEEKKMKRKKYRAIIDNDGHITTMIVGGYSKKSVTKELTDFFMKTKQIKDYRKFDIYLKEVALIDGKYVAVE